MSMTENASYLVSLSKDGISVYSKAGRYSSETYTIKKGIDLAVVGEKILILVEEREGFKIIEMNLRGEILTNFSYELPRGSTPTCFNVSSSLITVGTTEGYIFTCHLS